jgi:hypothetical protein
MDDHSRMTFRVANRFFFRVLAVFVCNAVGAVQSTSIDRQTPRSGEQAEPPDPKHREVFELINRSTNLLGWGEPNPVAVVRAVNHLYALGKDGAVETLRAYARYAPERGRQIEAIAPDQQRLCSIVPLLFVPHEQDADVPSLGRFPDWGGSKKWAPFYISLQGDLPFHDVKFGGRSGRPDPGRGYLVEWADEHARLRDKPLRPVDDPLVAADELLRRLLQENEDRTNVYNDDLKTHIRHQAWRTIAHLIPSEREKESPGWLSEEKWASLKMRTARLKIRWKDNEQNYVTE